MEASQLTETRQLRHLFDAELHYRPDAPVLVAAENREGELIGSGEGTVWGEALRGHIRWSMFSAECAYLLVKAGVQPSPGQHLCMVNPGGVIETDDGAQIWFDGKGFGLRGFDPAQPHRWRLTLALHFTTETERYRWLNSRLGVWEGEFDETAGRAHYRAYVQVLPEQSTTSEDHG